MGRTTELGLLIRASTESLFPLVCVDDIKIGRRKQNLNSVWKTLMKLVDLGEPTSFLHQVYLGCTQRECKSNESNIEEHKKVVRITNLRRSD